MADWKFDDTDRDKVFNVLGSVFSIEFKNVGRLKKYRLGTDGKYYCVIGGYEQWHAVPKETVINEIISPGTGILIYAKRNKDRIELYIGKIKPLADNEGLLSKNKKGAHHFHLIVDDKIVRVKEVPDCRLIKIYEFPFADYDVHTKKKFIEAIRKLSKEEVASILKRIEGT